MNTCANVWDVVCRQQKCKIVPNHFRQKNEKWYMILRVRTIEFVSLIIFFGLWNPKRHFMHFFCLDFYHLCVWIVWIPIFIFLYLSLIIYLGSGSKFSVLKMFGCSTPKTCAELKGSYLIQTSGTAYYSSSKISLQTKLRFYWASFKMPIM